MQGNFDFEPYLERPCQDEPIGDGSQRHGSETRPIPASEHGNEYRVIVQTAAVTIQTCFADTILCITQDSEPRTAGLKAELKTVCS